MSHDSLPTAPEYKLGTHETPVSEEDIARVRAFARRHWGMELPEVKAPLVRSRLARLAGRESDEELQEKLDALRHDPRPSSMLALFDVLSTNETSFFRHPDQFELLERHLAALPWERAAKIWSAGCSIGCEPYSVALTQRESPRLRNRPAARILATDLSRQALETAAAGVYSERHVASMSTDVLERYFTAQHDTKERHWALDESVLRSVTLGLVNIMGPWRMQGPFDAILCRNVLIYFTEEAKRKTLARFAELLRPGGILLVGATEAFSFCPPALTRTSAFCFQKT